MGECLGRKLSLPLSLDDVGRTEGSLVCAFQWPGHWHTLRHDGGTKRHSV
jgi:hypothetical protein